MGDLKGKKKRAGARETCQVMIPFFCAYSSGRIGRGEAICSRDEVCLVAEKKEVAIG